MSKRVRDSRQRLFSAAKFLVVALCVSVLAGGTGLLLVSNSAGAASPALPAFLVSPTVSLSRELPKLPLGARLLSPLPPTRKVNISVTLQSNNPAAVAAEVNAVSTPGSPQYRHYLAPGVFIARFGPSARALRDVRAWLRADGLTVGSVTDGFFLSASGSSSAVQRALGTRLSGVRLASGRVTYVNTSAPSVPSGVANDVVGVVGLDGIARWHSQMMRSAKRPPAFVNAGNQAGPASNSGPISNSGQTARSLVPHGSSGPQACSLIAANTGPGRGVYSITQLANAYNLGGLYAQGRTGAGESVAIFELEQYSMTDIQAFAQCYGIQPSISTTVVGGGPGGPQAGSGEAALDIENVMGFAPSAHISVYEGPNSATGVLDTYSAIAQNDSSSVVSTSWGICEAQNFPSGTAQSENLIFAQMAAQGQTVLAAAGDSGSEDCYPINSSTALQVDDPASQPYVTGAGGTSLTNGVAGTPGGEVAWNNCQNMGASCAQNGSGGAGGGGISTQWTMPTWQKSAGNGTINSYTSSGPCGASSGTYCREVPDVSASADPAYGYAIYYSGQWMIVGGTSAVAPLWSGVFALVDQGCASPVGFANPALYKLGSSSSNAFNDITSGNNDFTQTNSNAYPATSGYDMATGWGSPNGVGLLSGLQPSGGCPSVTGLSSANGPLTAGSVTTIYGYDLGNATSVNLGIAGNATILSDTSGAVTVSLPSVPSPIGVDITVTTPNGTSAVVPADRYAFGTPHTGLGYWLSASDGGIFAYGSAQFYGSMGGRPLNKPVVGIAVTPDDKGYWEVASDGGIFAFGDAKFYGSMGGRPLNQPIVAIASTPDGKGYWEVASDGGIFAFGDAKFYGSMGGRPLKKPIVGIAGTLGSGGYWEVASDGGIFAFGDAQFYGSMGGRPLNKPIVAMTGTPDGGGYFEVASDGGIFTFGNARFFGSAGSLPLVAPVVGMALA